MSDTASSASPAAPAQTSTPSTAPLAISAPPPPAEAPSQPAPKSQPTLSVSDAARLLGKRRAEAAGQGEAAKPEGVPAEGSDRPKPSPLDKAFGAPEAEAAAPAQPATPGMVEIDGKRYSPAELSEAIGKASDYTKKTQALAEQQRQIQAQHDALNLVLPYIQPELQKLQALVQGIPRPDTALLDSDPQRYFRELATFERAREEQARLFSVNQFQNQTQNQNLEQRVEEANKTLAEEFPFWADPAQRAEAQTEIVNWALGKGGYTRDELRNLSDARVLKTLMKASQFDKWVGQTRSQPVAQALRAPPVRGVPPPAPPSERVSVAQQAFDTKPNIRNGAQLLAARRQT